MSAKTIIGKLILAIICLNSIANAQQATNYKNVVNLISSCKEDIRGTYKSIQWFCEDGSVRAPKDPCPANVGGIQHATYKDAIVNLAKEKQLYFGQILAYTDKTEFWDEANNHSRLKQYQLGKYLARIDNGWVNRKGQYYRGAVQIEDEETWGVKFYQWLLSQNKVLEKDYYLIFQSFKDIPHQGDSDLSQLMRAQSKVISDQYTAFMDLRVKIHSNPEEEDIAKVIQFKKLQSTKLSSSLHTKLDELIQTMKRFHQPVDLKAFETQAKKLSGTSKLVLELKSFSSTYQAQSTANLVTASAALLLKIRMEIRSENGSNQKLKLFKLAHQLHSIIFKQANDWVPQTLDEQLQKIYALSMASAGTGLLELWEWETIEQTLKPTDQKQLSLAELNYRLETARSTVEWSSGMVKAVYQETVNLYLNFEPLAYSFTDDRIRSSISLQLGEAVGTLGKFIAKESALTNKVLNLTNTSTFRGLNPGYAFGELVVVNGSPEDVKVFGDKIYVFDRAPSDLKPVAGIATVAEGNLVSHVQLLARNLGIPNTALSDQNLKDLLPYNGKKVFYAVSNKGNVIIKLEADMSVEEKALFTKKARKEEKIEVPINQIKLSLNKILNLNEVNASHSGKLCGPKAANLGQLKELFPNKVVEGFVIPFGIFRKHMDKQMPQQNKTYWQFLNDMFAQAESMRQKQVAETEIENYQLRQLEILRDAIKKITLDQQFVKDIEMAFKDILGTSLGNVPVFLRSDTNMEDLKDFTGAGLNLTIFNVLEREKVLQGIRDVWASPYTERSFKWRQKYLLNPENVFPSILVIPSVDVDYSGVMITKGVTSGNDQDLTIAFSRGAGGAVDGQAAEAYLLKDNGQNQLLSPAREAHFNTLPSTGGTGKKSASFEKSILNDGNLKDIRELAAQIRTTLAQKTASHYKGAYDVEFGFKDNQLWLFQIRPFVENKKALGSNYLESITPKIDLNKQISLSTKL